MVDSQDKLYELAMLLDWDNEFIASQVRSGIEKEKKQRLETENQFT